MQSDSSGTALTIVLPVTEDKGSDTIRFIEESASACAMQQGFRLAGYGKLEDVAKR